MKNVKIVLASASPRRRELLGSITSDFQIYTKDVDETVEESLHPKDAVVLLALRKGRAVMEDLPEDTLIISADTLVELDGVPLGKPRDFDDACNILSRLSGRSHNVHTGVAVHYKGRALSGVATSSVRFLPLTSEQIENYVRTGEPMDKAGAYGIQGAAGVFVEGYDGDFDTIVGLPCKLCRELLTLALEDMV